MDIDSVYQKIAKNIKKCRKEKNITQQQLSELAGYSYENIRRIEAPNCKKSFSIELVYFISVALNVPLSKLLELEDKEMEENNEIK